MTWCFISRFLNILDGAGGPESDLHPKVDRRPTDDLVTLVQPNLFAFCQNQKEEHRDDVCNGKA